MEKKGRTPLSHTPTRAHCTRRGGNVNYSGPNGSTRFVARTSDASLTLAFKAAAAAGDGAFYEGRGIEARRDHAASLKYVPAKLKRSRGLIYIRRRG